MSLDQPLWIAGIGAEIALIVVLALKGAYRKLPVFSLYVVWMAVSDLAMMGISRSAPAHYFKSFLVQLSVDSVFQFCVVLELAWSVFRPARATLSRRSVFALGGFILLIGAVLWPVAGLLVRQGYSREWHLLFQLQQTTSILRILVFVALAALSQLLAIGWRDRELQIATGLGIYSLASLGAAALHTHSETPTFYHGVDQAVMAVYLCSLVYWTVSFLQKEAPRQEFSPRMQSFLVTVAGNARTARLSMEDARHRK